MMVVMMMAFSTFTGPTIARSIKKNQFVRVNAECSHSHIVKAWGLVWWGHK